MNVRIMLPTTPELFFPFHTGLLYGHGIASRSIWMPFCDVTEDEDKSRSMQILSIKKSRELIQYAIDKRLSMDEMTELFGKESWQIKAGPGSGCFFTQENIHGSGRPNTSGKTRVSMDFRVAEGIYGDYLGRKIPAGYFHLIPDTEEEEETLAAHPRRADGFLQRQKQHFLRRQQHGLHLRNTGAPAALHAGGLLQKEKPRVRLRAVRSRRHDPSADAEIPGRRSASATSSCTASSRCRRMRPIAINCWKRRSKRGCIIHFVNEDLQLGSGADLTTIKKYLEFSKYGKSRLPIGLPLTASSKMFFDKWAGSLAQLD